MTWAEQTMYGFDTETTGVDVFTDRIVTATVVKVVDGIEVDKRTWLIDPGIEIPETATKVHGITTEHARANGVHPTEALDGGDGIAAMVAGVLRASCPLVLFNAAYDLSILEAELRRHDLGSINDRLPSPEKWQAVIDPMVLGKGIDTIKNRKFVKGRKFTLPALCDWYKVPFTESHDATADATGAVLLAAAIANSDPYLGDMGPGPLHQLQKTWRREMCNSLRAYFDREGIDHDGVDGGWPLHTNLQAVHA